MQKQKKEIIKLSLLLLLYVVSITAHGQTVSSDFGEISLDELKMTTYAQDTSAGAVILFDKAESSGGMNRALELTRHVRIKILKKTALKWGNFSIAIPRAGVNMTKIQGATYNLIDGKIEESKMNSESIFKTKLNRDIESIKFALPNVREGSVFEFSYVIRGNSLTTVWQFQYAIPVIRSQYQTSVPQLLLSKTDLQGYLPLEKNTNNNYKGRTFAMSNVPAFKLEPFTNTPEDYLSKIHFYPLLLSWDKLIKSTYSNPLFGAQIRGSEFLKSKTDELTSGVAGQANKTKVIYDYIKENISWDGSKDRIPDRLFEKVIESRKGSSSEINLILLTMLRKAGINAEPVFISTRDHGKVRPEAIQFQQFNYVICQVSLDNKKILLDATDPYLPFSILPQRCLNSIGLLCSEFGFEWIEIPSSKSKEVFHFDLTLEDSGTLTGILNITRDGLAGGHARAFYKRSGEKKYIDSLLEKRDMDVTSSQFSNMTSTVESVKEKYDIKINNSTQAAGTVIYISPIVTERLEKNPFVSETRYYPVDLPSAYEKLFVAKLIVPENYIVEELPKAKLISLPNNNGKFAYNVTQNKNEITVVSHLTVNKNIFLPEEYPYLKEFYDQISSKQAEQIVLKRK